tara:strand:- start:10535 stop:11431 length:897 start_codon:yes stop_codon:yes gene_type:complete
MATNSYLDWNDSDEQNLYESLVIESLQFYGQDVYYIPRDLISTDEILNEEIESRFNDFIEIEMYLETVDAFEGDGSLFSKFGFEMRNQIKLIVSQMRFEEEINSAVGETRNILRPREGDLIYHAMTKGLYEIRYADSKTPSFYNLGNLPVHRLTCELFEYSGESLDTGIDEIDDIQDEFTVLPMQIQTSVSYSSGSTLTITSNDSPTFTATAEVLSSTISNDLRLGNVTFDTEFFVIAIGLSVSDGTTAGTITAVHDLLDPNSPTLPELTNVADNAEGEEQGNSLLDDSRVNPIGQVT